VVFAMFESLRALIHGEAESRVEQRFERAAYRQDDPNRQLQVLFFKLLMALAAADGHVNLEEINLLKDFVFEHSLTEEEWAEIQYYATAPLSKDALAELTRTVIAETRTRADREQFASAIKEMADADRIVADVERQILEISDAELGKVHVPVLGYVLKTLRLAWRRRLSLPPAIAAAEAAAREYAENPVAALLARHSPEAGDAELLGAKLGLVLLVLRTDDAVGPAELDAFAGYAAQECARPADEAKQLVDRLLTIPTDLLELTYLARVLVEGLDPAQRRTYLDELARIAVADGTESFEESRTLRLIAKYLYVPLSGSSYPPKS
jgi:uncharacterized tellurite resistance protein B-like protein